MYPLLSHDPHICTQTLTGSEAPPLTPRQALDLPERADKPQAGTQTDTQTLHAPTPGETAGLRKLLSQS